MTNSQAPHPALLAVIVCALVACIHWRESIAQPAKSAPLVHPHWDYNERTDPMSGAIERYAVIQSANEFTFKFPYANPQRGLLLVRESARRGLNIMLRVERGQFMCRVSGCSVLVRFDESAPVRYSAVGPNDSSSTVLFINNEHQFLKALKAAKRARIETVVYQEGSVMMEFNVAGLVWNPRPAQPKGKK